MDGKVDAPEMLRAVAYHGTPVSARDAFVRQLDFLVRHFQSVDEAGLGRFARGDLARNSVVEKPTVGKPLLIISFDDGLLNNYEVAAPLLEERGLVGWFFVASGLVGLPDTAQVAFCREHEISLGVEGESGQTGRIAMSWAELADLSRRGHVIGCHTATHRRMRGKIAETVLSQEIYGPKRMLEETLGKQVYSFAWVGGEPDTYSRIVFEALPKAGFKYAFTTQSAPYKQGEDPLLVHRTVLDADMGYVMFRLKVAGLSDLVHIGRRGRSVSAMKP